jgi:hypothetical protein
MKRVHCPVLFVIQYTFYILLHHEFQVCPACGGADTQQV